MPCCFFVLFEEGGRFGQIVLGLLFHASLNLLAQLGLGKFGIFIGDAWLEFLHGVHETRDQIVGGNVLGIETTAVPFRTDIKADAIARCITWFRTSICNLNVYFFLSNSTGSQQAGQELGPRNGA